MVEKSSSDTETRRDAIVKVGSQNPIEAAPDPTPPSPSEITWRRFVDEGFATSLPGNQVSLKEQLNRVETKLNLYIPRSFDQVTLKYPIEDKIPIQCVNQRMSKLVMLLDGSIVNIEVSVLYFNKKLWVKFSRSDSYAYEYFLYHASVSIKLLSPDNKIFSQLIVSENFFDLMVPTADLMDMRCLTSFDIDSITDKKFVFYFKIIPIEFKLEVSDNITAQAEDASYAQNTDHIGDYYYRWLCGIAENSSYSDADSRQSSLYPNLFDGAPLLDEDVDDSTQELIEEHQKGFEKKGKEESSEYED